MFAPESRVKVHPFSLQAEGDEVVIGHAGGSYIAVPAEAVEILRDLEEGKTPAEVQELFFQRHGERPELDDFLEGLHRRGFVEPEEVRTDGDEEAAPSLRMEKAPSNRLTLLSRLLFGRAALLVYLLVVLAAGVAVVASPQIVPGRSALFFPRHRTLNGLLLLLLAYTSVFVHEMGHLLAARAVGVNSRIGVGQRLWVVVAETDLTGLWSIPKRRRYLPLLAGCIVDVVSAALLLLVSFAAVRGEISLSPTLRQFVGAMVFVYFMRILWQCYLFLRTDFYYLIGALTGCKNLMEDTETFLRNQLARWRTAAARIDQSSIPPREMRVVRLYAGIWLVGRLLAFAVLLGVTIPVALYYLRSLVRAARLGIIDHPYPFLDSLCVTATFVVPLVVGMRLWVRSLVKARRVQP